MKAFSLLANERIASIRDIQRNPSRALSGVTRVMKGSETIGFFLANDDFADLVESHEALSSKAYIRRIAKARRDIKAGKGQSLESLAREYGL
ncbi:MAG: hypothetical protein WC477_07530 [Patescibacteria group bacterium]